MLDKIPAIMIHPAVVIDALCDPAGLKVVFSDGTSKVLTCVGGGGGPTPATDFQISAPASLNFASGSTTAQQASISLTNLVGDPGAVSVTVTAVPKSIPVYFLESITYLSEGTGYSAGDLANVYFTGSNAAVAPGYGQRVILITDVNYPGGHHTGHTVYNVGGYYSTDGAAINLSSGYMQSAGGGYTTFSGGVAAPLGSFISGFTVSPTFQLLSSSTPSGTFTVTPDAGIAAGTYIVSITATGNGVTRTAEISLTVAAP